MPDPWVPEIPLSVADAAALVRGQFPDIDDPPALLGVGFDNMAVRFGEWVFRFPRKQIAVDFLLAEIAELPALATKLPLPLPVPERIGAPADGYPWPFAGYRHVAGTPASEAGLTPADRAALAKPIARFLAALHAIDAHPALPGDRMGKSDLPDRARRLRDWLPRVPDLDAVPIGALLDELATTPPWSQAPRFVHGDLYGRHLLVDGRRRLCGVIDWGDLHAGDPALDLSVAFTFVPASAHEAFRDAYGGIDDATWRRARFHAWRYALFLLPYGREVGDEGMIRMAGWALATLVSV